MTTCRDIVTLALRQARVVGVGRSPRAAEAAEGMTALQSLYDSMFSHGPLGPFTEVYATEDYTAKEDERIIADNATITIPDSIEVYGDDPRTPTDLAAVVVITDTTRLQYVFSLGRWEVCHGLSLDDVAPLAERDKTGLAALLAKEYAEMFGAQLTPATMMRAMRFQGDLSSRFSTKSAEPEYF
jgi:hypothetical protein